MTPAASAKPRIVIVTHEFAPFRGGVAIYSAELAAALHRAGQTLEVWAPDYGARGAREELAVPVVRLRAGGSLGFWDMVQFARQLAARRSQLEPATVLLAEDDPMIPVADLARLAPSPYLTVVRTRHGGHCGFVEQLNGPSFADRFIVAQFARFERETPQRAPADIAAVPVGLSS